MGREECDGPTDQLNWRRKIPKDAAEDIIRMQRETVDTHIRNQNKKD
jgi:hypothetical protein